MISSHGIKEFFGNRPSLRFLYAVWSLYPLKKIPSSLPKAPKPPRSIIAVTPGLSDGQWEVCLVDALVRIGWDDLGDLRDFRTKKQLFSKYRKLYGVDGNGNPRPDETISATRFHGLG